MYHNLETQAKVSLKMGYFNVCNYSITKLLQTDNLYLSTIKLEA